MTLPVILDALSLCIKQPSKTNRCMIKYHTQVQNRIQDVLTPLWSLKKKPIYPRIMEYITTGSVH